MDEQEQRQQQTNVCPEHAATGHVAHDYADVKDSKVLVWVEPNEADPAFVNWRRASGAVPTHVAIGLAGTPGELVAWMVPFEEDEELDAETEAGIAALRAALAEGEAGSPASQAEQTPPMPNEGFETLAPADQLKRFFDWIGIGAQEGFAISRRYEFYSEKTGEWHETWSHLYAERKGRSGNAELFDHLKYGKRTPSDRTKGTLTWWYHQVTCENKRYRNTHFYIRTARFKHDLIDHKVRSIELPYVDRIRAYSVEIDGLPLVAQQELIAQFRKRGLVANAEVFSGGKSIHLFFTRPGGWESSTEEDAYISAALCVLFQGDPQALARNNLMRIPGCQRPGGLPQQLLDGRAETFGSYEELRLLVDSLLNEQGITSEDELNAALAKLRASSEERFADKARARATNSVIGEGWANWGGWSEQDYTAARGFTISLSADQLLDFLSRSARDLVIEGSLDGHRWFDGTLLTLSLRGAVDVLTDLGLDVEEAAATTLARFIEASEAIGGPVDRDRLQAQYEATTDATPGRTVQDFLHQLWFHTGGQLGERRPRPALPAGSSGLEQLLYAIGPGEWEQDEDGAPIRPPKISVGHFAEMLEGLGPLLRWNDLAQQVEYNGEILHPDQVEYLYIDLHRQDRYINQKTAIDVVVSRSRRNRYDPVRDYLEYVEQAEDIQAADLSSLASTYLGTEDPLYDKMLRIAVLGAVSRRMEPGCQFDYVVVLKGDQGIRKSSFWKVLASPAWYTSSVPDDDKDLLLNIHSTWFFELAELEHITNKKSAGKLKNTITTAVDNYRVPYGKASEQKPRLSIFVSSVNGEAFLRDDTGERRYYVIECPQVYAKGELIDVDAVVRDRDRIWKAGIQAYRAGEKPYLSNDLQNESNRRNEDYQVENPWAGPLDEWLNPTEYLAKWVDYSGDISRGAPEQFTTAQALIGCGVRDPKSLRKSDEMEIAQLLTQRGYVKRRVKIQGRPRQWLWSKSETVT